MGAEPDVLRENLPAISKVTESQGPGPGIPASRQEPNGLVRHALPEGRLVDHQVE